MSSAWTGLLLATCILGLSGCRNEACEGSITLTTRADIDAVLDCTHFTQLGIHNSELTSVELPNLVTVERDLGIGDNARLTSVSFPSLSSVGGSVRIRGNSLLSSVKLAATELGFLEFIDNLELETFEAPGLTRLTAGGMVVTNQSALETLSLPALTSASPSLLVHDNARLRQLELPRLTRVQGESSALRVDRNRDLALLDLSLLTEAPAVIAVTDNDSLVDVALPSLPAATMIVVSANRALAVVSAPMLTSLGSELDISKNPTLESLDLASLVTAGCVHIHDNMALPDCEVESVIAAVEMTCGKTSRDNKGDGCP